MAFGRALGCVIAGRANVGVTVPITPARQFRTRQFWTCQCWRASPRRAKVWHTSSCHARQHRHVPTPGAPVPVVPTPGTPVPDVPMVRQFQARQRPVRQFRLCQRWSTPVDQSWRLQFRSRQPRLHLELGSAGGDHTLLGFFSMLQT